MDNTTLSKIKLEERKNGTVVIVSGGKTWYSYIGGLPVTENGKSLKDELYILDKQNKRLTRQISDLGDKLSVVSEVLLDLLETQKKEKESDGL